MTIGIYLIKILSNIHIDHLSLDTIQLKHSNHIQKSLMGRRKIRGYIETVPWLYQ